MTESSIVAVVYQDLAEAYAELSSESASRKAVRQSFTNFVDLSQKLTSHMRKEYSEKKEKPWVASDFGGWNDVTELFKQLRNDDQHDRPVSILVDEAQYFRVSAEGATEIALSGTWSFSLGDQLADTPRDDLRLELADPKTGRPSGRFVSPTRKEYEFHLSPSSKKAELLLTKIGNPNVRTLSENCFAVLTDYYRYYKRQLAQS